MPYSRLFYHVTWATRDRLPLIDDTVARVLEQSIYASCEEKGIRLYAVGIMPDHVHVAVSIPPRIAIATFVGRLKGAATYAINGATAPQDRQRFAWQAEYGVLSFGQKALPDVVAYVRNQRARHAANQLWEALERTTDPLQPA